MATRWSLTIDCAHPARLAEFWAFALGYVSKPPPAGFASWEEWLEQHGVPEEEWDEGAALSDPDGVGPSLSFLQVPESKVVKNRLHLDVQVGGGRETPWEIRWPRVVEAVERLTAAGATVIREHDLDGRPAHLAIQPGGWPVLVDLLEPDVPVRPFYERPVLVAPSRPRR